MINDKTFSHSMKIINWYDNIKFKIHNLISFYEISFIKYIIKYPKYNRYPNKIIYIKFILYVLFIFLEK